MQVQRLCEGGKDLDHAADGAFSQFGANVVRGHGALVHSEDYVAFAQWRLVRLGCVQMPALPHAQCKMSSAARLSTQCQHGSDGDWWKHTHKPHTT